MGDSDPNVPDQQSKQSASNYPVLAWEDAAHRVVLPRSLRLALGVDDLILRWARQKRELVLALHANDAEVIQDIGDISSGGAVAGSSEAAAMYGACYLRSRRDGIR
jgi:hypothetical protein